MSVSAQAKKNCHSCRHDVAMTLLNALIALRSAINNHYVDDPEFAAACIDADAVIAASAKERHEN